MDFWDAFLHMRKGKKVTLPELPDRYWIERGKITTFGSPYYDLVLVNGQTGKWDSLRLCDRILVSEDWKLYEEKEESAIVRLVPKVVYPVICPKCNVLITEFENVDHEGEKIRCAECGLKIELTNGRVG